MLETVLPTDRDRLDGKLQLEALNGNVAHNQNDIDYDLPPDECWLFKFPKPKPNSTSHRHTVKPINLWLREVFDSPDSCFYASRYNLINRLETILLSGGPISAYRFGGSVPSLNMSTSGSNVNVPVGKQFPFDANSLSTGLDSNFAGSNQSVVGWSKTCSSDGLQHSATNLGTVIQNQRPDTSPGSSFSRAGSTFARISLPKYSLPPQYSASCQRRLSNVSSNSTSHLGNSIGQGFPGSVSTTGSFDELQLGAGGKANVQEIARIQEDNLKAEVAALVAAAGRRGSQHSLTSLGRRSPEGGGGAIGDVFSPLGGTNFSASSTSNSLAMLQASGAFVGSNNSCMSADGHHQPSVYPTDVYDGAQYFLDSTNQVPSVNGNQLYNPMSQDQTFVSTEQQLITSQSGRRMQVAPFLANTDQPTRPQLLPNFPSTQSGIPISAEQRNQFGFRSIRRPAVPLRITSLPPGSAVQGASKGVPSSHTPNSGTLLAKHYG